MKTKSINKKILIAPVEIAGFYNNLSIGFDCIGVENHFAPYHVHQYGYGDKKKFNLIIRLIQYINKHKNKTNRFIRIVFLVVREFLTTLWGLFAILKYDVFIFGFGQSLLRYNIDLYILNYLNKTVISHLGHGSESRPAYLNGSTIKSFSGTEEELLEYLNDHSSKTLKKIRRFEKMSTYIISHHFTNYFFKDNYISSSQIGVPFTNNYTLVGEKKINTHTRILHAPSNPRSKGTSIIEKAIFNLIKKGYSIDLIKLNGVPNSKVIDELKKCDFIVDQVYSDGPMPGFATEAAFYGKPAVVGGYGLEMLKDYVKDWPPSKICIPEEIERAIEKLITDKKERIRLGRQAREHVTEKWTPEKVASRFKKIIEGDIPENWWVNPYQISYLHGYGQSENEIKKIIRQLVVEYGSSVLQLDHNPSLKDKFLKFSKNSH